MSKKWRASLGILLVLLFALVAYAQSIANWPAPLLWSPAQVAQTAAGPGEAREGQAGQPAAYAETLAAVPTPPLPLIGINPCRVADTRDVTRPAGYGPPSLAAGAPRNFTLTGQCGVAGTAQAVSLNITVTNTLGPGFILIYPQGGAQPLVSTLNYLAGQTVANAAVVPLGTGGGITVVAGVSGTDVIIDTNGYYAPQNVVNTLNTLTGDVTLAAGTNVTITPSGQTLTIGATGGGGGVPSVNGITGAVTVTGAGSVGVGTAGSTITVTGPGSLPPAGPAGGSLSGSYPNPSLGSGAVSAPNIASGQVVKSINGTAQDAVTITGSGGTTVSTVGSAITVATPGFVPTGSFLLGNPNDTTLIGAGFSETGFTQDFWKATSTAGVPTARNFHTAVWTGTKMIVWGGFDVTGFDLFSGGQYDPVANSWTATSNPGFLGRTQHTAIWTGTRMIVWGGCENFGCATLLNTGGQYDPVGNSWTATSTASAPTARYQHTAVWTGTKLIVWGGSDGVNFLNTGGRYDPVGNSWTATSTTGAPTARSFDTAVWTGTRMIVWGGYDGFNFLNTGGRYDPVGNSWTATSTAGAPTGRTGHTAVWTGTRMIVWGGCSGGACTTLANTGGQYDPVGDSWTATTTTGAVPTARGGHTAVWTGTRMIVWGGNDGGFTDTGGQYDPVGDSWTATSTAGAPTGRTGHTAVWTGTRMIVWGGTTGGVNVVNTGGQWSPLSLYVKN